MEQVVVVWKGAWGEYEAPLCVATALPRIRHALRTLARPTQLKYSHYQMSSTPQLQWILQSKMFYM